MCTSSLTKLLIVIGGYLLGTLLPAEWIVHKRTGRTPHELGDNPGGSGTYRLAGLWAAVFVIAFDITKGFLPAAAAEQMRLKGSWLIAAVIAPVAGHNWPFHKKFNGGKGMAPALGAIGWLAWPLTLPAYLLGAIAARWKRWAPMMGIVAFPTVLIFMGLGNVPREHIRAAAAVILVLVVRQLPWLWDQIKESKISA